MLVADMPAFFIMAGNEAELINHTPGGVHCYCIADMTTIHSGVTINLVGHRDNPARLSLWRIGRLLTIQKVHLIRIKQTRLPKQLPILMKLQIYGHVSVYQSVRIFICDDKRSVNREFVVPFFEWIVQYL